MTKRILMRLGKSPFRVGCEWETLEKNFIGGNNGNLIFGLAAHKLFSTKGTVIDANHYRIHPKMADQVNDEYDAFVLPLANAFRPSFQTELRNTTAFIEKLKIPFLMLSGGAQLPLSGDATSLEPIRDDVKRFARAVLNHSHALSVRGERTADYLKSLGIHQVEVVGCPSLTFRGPGHQIRVPNSLSADAKIAYNIETSLDLEIGLFESIEAQYDAVYFPQDRRTLEGMLWGTDPYEGRPSGLPLSRSHTQFTQGKAEYHLDAFTWIERLRAFDFSVGSRIHGNIAAILAGTPAYLLAHDSRTLELAEFFHIPVRKVIPGKDSGLTIAEVIEDIDYSSFNRNHALRFNAMSDFIVKGGFEHIYEEGNEDDEAEYMKRLYRTEFPEPARDLAVAKPENQNIAAALRILQNTNTKQQKQINLLRADFRALTK